MAKMIVVNEERCLGCGTCVLECAVAHCDAGTLVEALGSQTHPQPRVHLEPLADLCWPMQCRHCQDAPCMNVCPADAIHRDSPEGPVLIDNDLCVGCRLCLVVCPFGAIDMSPDRKKAVKCDLCIERTRRSLSPACSSACPTGALEFRALDESLRLSRRERFDRVSAAVTEAGSAEVSGETTDAEPGKCSRCSATFAKPGQLRRLREKFPQQPIPTLCPACRRLTAANTLAQTATPPHKTRGDNPSQCASRRIDRCHEK